MKDDRDDRANEITDDHYDNIQYQNKKVEAMRLEIAENKMDDDKPREEYLLDVEIIKLEVINEDRIKAVDQIDKTYSDKEGIEDLSIKHISNDVNNDADRLNTVIDVEDMQIRVLNENSENVWDQEDEVMNTKVEVELLRDDIVANNLKSDVPREDHLEVVEKMNISYEKRDSKNTSDQL